MMCWLVLMLLPGASGFAGTVNRAGYHELDHHPPRGRQLEEPNPYKCKDGVRATDEDWRAVGTNLGGWLVLEPWITPSLFYQFLGADVAWGIAAARHTAMDTYTFCKALGPKEANAQLRRHWKAWLREEDIASIAATGATHVRLPQ